MQATRISQGNELDYIPAAAVLGGAVVLFGGTPLVANMDIPANRLGALAAEGVFDVVKDATVFAIGDDVYWDATGDPNGGVADSGAASTTGVFMGRAVKAAATGDLTVQTKISYFATSREGQVSVATVAALGTVQADATQIPAGVQFVNATGGDAAKGIKLPAAAAGLQINIKNNAAAVLKVWPATGDGINAIAVNTNIAMAANTSAIFTAIDGTTWITTPLVPS